MFDFLHAEDRDESLEIAKAIFVDFGDELTEAAMLLGGANGLARVASCGRRIEAATRMTRGIRNDVHALCRLFSLDAVGDPDCLETALFSDLDPNSVDVERICLLTDHLADLLDAIDTSMSGGSRKSCVINPPAA